MENARYPQLQNVKIAVEKFPLTVEKVAVEKYFFPLVQNVSNKTHSLRVHDNCNAASSANDAYNALIGVDTTAKTFLTSLYYAYLFPFSGAIRADLNFQSYSLTRAPFSDKALLAWIHI